MDSTASSLLFMALFCILCSNSMGFNITRILSNYPEFSSFNNLLTQTGLAQQINTRQTITVLAVSNGAMGGISGKPIDVVKRILSAHVILDYYDEMKLQNVQKKSSILTTLYQTSGNADDEQGFLNVTKTPNGIMFASAVKGAPVAASLKGSLASQPYNISVLQVSNVIQPPGIDNMPAPAPTSAKTPAPVSAAPTDAHEAPTPAAPAPDADTPATSPPEPNTPPADDETPAAAPAHSADDETPAAAPAHSASSRLHVRGGVAVAMGLFLACIMGF